jgi:hypothetical protein
MEPPFKISHSKVKTGRRCLRAYYYKYVLKLMKRIKSRPLYIGGLVHECLESYFKNGHYLPVIKEWEIKEFSKMFKEEQALNSDIIPLVKVLMRGYIKNWKSLDLTMEWVEKEIEVEIAPGIVLIGKVDGKARDSRGRKWLVEHKTCKKMPGEEVRTWDTQAILYDKALRMVGEERLVGVIWDYLRTKLPVKPEVLKSGGLSTRKNIDTTPEVYLREIKRHGLNPKGYTDILAELTLKRDSFYRQVKLPFSIKHSDRVMKEMVVTSKHLIYMENHHSDNELMWFRNLTRDCDWCDFKTLCHAELRGEDTEYLLKHDYSKRVKR